MDYVIIGGDAAGMSAAMQIVRRDETANITVLERGAYYSYAQCGLPYIIGGAVNDSTDLIARSVETFRNKYGIDANIYHEVTNIDIENKTVSGWDREKASSFTFSYDRLLIATGADPVVPNWPGINLNGVYTVKTIPDIHAIVDTMDSIRNVTIIGGGYIGLEMAENFKDAGIAVTIIDRGQQLAKMFDQDMAALVKAEAEANGVCVQLEEDVLSIEGKQTVSAVMTDKGRYETDMVIVATGVRPNTSFIKDTPIHTLSNGAIRVNRYMETNVKDVFAAGDCASQYHRVIRKESYVPLGTHANKQGRIAGLNMAGMTRSFQGIVGTSILKYHRLTLARTGLNEGECQQMNIQYETNSQKLPHIAGYYKGKKPLHIKLIYESQTEELLGGQVIGEEGVDKRIDVLATALYHRMTLTQLEDLDLAYAPPYNSVWDPLQLTARRAR